MHYQLDRKLVLMFTLFTVITIVTLFVRNAIAGNTIHNSLLWNFFLGFVPLLIAAGIVFIQDKLNNFWLFVAGGVWLLFYPNAPYIISDFIHVRSDQPAVAVANHIFICNAVVLLRFVFHENGLGCSCETIFQKYC